MKPRVFIASSVEGISLAYAAQSNLQHDAECTVWDQGVFTPSAYPIDDIVAELCRSDFGIFVFSPDDAVTIRKEEKKAVRDNVVFELGLFMGYLSRERTFILQPRGVEDLRIPTDLTGIKSADFETGRQDQNDRAALGPACDEIRKVIKKLGSFVNPVESTVTQLDDLVLGVMGAFGSNLFFSRPQLPEPENSHFNHSIQRLRELKCVRFELSPDASQY